MFTKEHGGGNGPWIFIAVSLTGDGAGRGLLLDHKVGIKREGNHGTGDGTHHDHTGPENGSTGPDNRSTATIEPAPVSLPPTTATAPPSPITAAPVAPMPPPTAAPATSPATGPGGCYPTTSTHKCYKAGQFCPAGYHARSGIDGNGQPITCRPSGAVWKWLAS